MKKLLIYILCLSTLNFSNARYSSSNQLNFPTASRNKRQINNGSCQIPSNPPNGRYAISGDETNTYKEGDFVPEYLFVLYIKCDGAYKPSPPEVVGSFCVNGWWDPPPSVCSRTCKTLRSTVTTEIKCSFNNLHLKNCDNAVEGTVAKFSCAALYEDPSIESNPYRFCDDGDWNGIPQCYPICGQKHPEGQVNIIKGTVAKMGDYPWHVGVYTDQRDFICGGAVITQTIVLSAAHCFANLGTGKVHPKENYLIAAGKYYRDYSDARDIHSQYSTIDSINIPSNYKGSKLQHQADIAVIVLTRHFVLSEAIQPVCVDWSDSFENQQLTPNNEGIVTGWGYTQEGLNLAEELKELSIPFIPFDQCFEAIPREFQTYLRSDKICGGYLKMGTSVCQGDSGGALAFPKRNTGRYFIRGIVSTSPATVEKQCDSNQYGIYTLVSEYLDFINNVRIMHRRHQANTLPAVALPTISNISHIASTVTTTAKICATPQSPENGIYIIGRSIRNQSSSTASDLTGPLDYLIVRCDEGFTVTKTDTSICVDGNWNPDPSGCTQSRKPSEEDNGRCRTPDNQNGNCTIITNCQPLIQFLSNSPNPTAYQRTKLSQYQCGISDERSPKVCCPSNGKVQIPLSENTPTSQPQIDVSHHKNIRLLPSECGIAKIEYSTSEKEAGLFQSPWIALLSYHTKICCVLQFQCGGSVLNKRYILTAANCITEDLVGVRVGEHNISSTIDCEEEDGVMSCAPPVQDVGIEKTIVHPSYLSSGRQVRAGYNIALIRLSTRLSINENVRPICLPITNDLMHTNLVGRNVTVIGFGTREYDPPINVLQLVKKTVTPEDQCITAYRKTNIEIGNTQLCAMDSVECNSPKEDGGGPLQGPNFGHTQGSARIYQYGIVSIIGPIGVCDSIVYPSAYTRVSSYMQWILDNIES